MGCLKSIGALFAVGALAAVYLLGFGVFVIADDLFWRWLGIGAMAVAAALTWVGARSTRFAIAGTLLVDPASAVFGSDSTLAPDPVDPDYHAVTGVHPGPAIAAVLALIGALLCGAALLFP